MLKILTVIGARPQIIKAAAINRAIAAGFSGRIQETLLHTGQHYDANMSQVFFDELGIPRPDIQLSVGSGSHGAQTARMLEGIEQHLQADRPDVVLLYGDTNSTLAGAVAASKIHIPVAHVEAGLRSFNKSMPEEINRIVCDHCSTWLFCPTDTAVENLKHEGFRKEMGQAPSMDAPAVHQSGDVMYDNSLFFSSVAAQRSLLLRDPGVENGNYVLVTVHRDHNTDVPAKLNAIFGALLELHRNTGLDLVIPVHPRTRKCMERDLDGGLRKALEAAKGIHMIPPAGFLDMIHLEQHARLVITDSGGVQKEAYFFGKPSVILRPETEWVELVDNGQAVLADADPVRILEASEQFLDRGMPACPPLFGDGHAAERICSVLLQDLGR